MNIGSLIRGLLGDSKPGEAKALELKEGQVVRGVVLSVSESGKEAVVQIQGAPVRAELETPLQPGQSMTLQVAPPGEGGLPVLKALSLGEAVLSSPQSMGEALESLGLVNSKAGREIIQAMVSGGLPLTQETAAQLDAVMSAKPQGVPASEWLESAVISLKRGLPVTAESVKGLQQAVFGPQLHELLAKLETELGVWAQQENEQGSGNGKAAPGGSDKPAASAAASTAGAGAAVDISSGDEAGDVRLAAGKGAGGAVAADDAALAAKSAAQPADMQRAAAGRTDQNSAAAPLSGHQEAAAGSASGAQPPAGGESAEGGILPAAGKGKEAPASGTSAAGTQGNAAAGTAAETSGANGKAGTAEAAGAAAKGEAPPVADAGAGAGRSGTALLAKLQGVLTELRGTLPQPGGQAGADAQPGASAAPPAAAGQEQAPAAAAPRGDSPAAAAQQPGQAPTPAQDTESWVGRVLKLLGAEHEQQAVRGGASTAADRTAAASAAALQAAGGGAEAADTLKGVLLQVMGSSDAPPAVKDAAGQLIQQLTGQQLLLNTDRTSPFAQVTLFLPLRGADGQETASIHIQSRRGRKGELDAANCRLWFDLDMKQLGQTMVDVHVVDRMVSLKLHNNNPWVLELLEERRDDAAAAIESIGYQLSSLRTESLPGLDLAAASAKNTARLTDYVPDSYKGVDYRI